MRRTVLSLVFLGILSTAPRSARADVPPPDACTAVGEACNNAGTNYDQPGTCVTSTCTRQTPDGSMQYECSRCVAGSSTGGSSGAGGGAASGGAGGSSTAGSAGSAGSGQTPDTTSDDGCGCSFAHDPPATPGWLVAFGLTVLALRRSRRD